MPATEVFVYQDEDGAIPVLNWLRELKRRNRPAFDKCLFLLDLLELYGSELRRPRADLLRDGIYELRTEVRNVNYRLLYGFVGKDIALVSHGLTKEAKVPNREIEIAVARLEKYKQNPAKYRASTEVIHDEEENE